MPIVSVIYLVRHGQASFGTDNYDRLSELGHQQAALVGTHLLGQGLSPDLVVTGGMLRQQQTAQGLLGSAGAEHQIATHRGWDEFDSSDLIGAYPEQDPLAKTDTRAFQRLLEKASARWASGEHDADYKETFTAFTSRVEQALKQTAADLGKGGSAVVVSSSGAIAWTAAQLLGGGFDQWLALNRVTVNSGVTKIVSGSSGITLVSYNEHCHLPSKLVTYR